MVDLLDLDWSGLLCQAEASRRCVRLRVLCVLCVLCVVSERQRRAKKGFFSVKKRHRQRTIGTCAVGLDTWGDKRQSGGDLVICSRDCSQQAVTSTVLSTCAVGLHARLASPPLWPHQRQSGGEQSPESETRATRSLAASSDSQPRATRSLAASAHARWPPPSKPRWR